MTATLLLDLDDTLLTNPLDAFLAGYMKALANHMSPYIPPEQFLSTLNAATRRMAQNTDPECTLKDVFDAHFYPALRVSPSQIRVQIEEFYAEVFPTLKKITSPRPEAIAMVEQAVQRGDRLVVATNPLFPRTAIEQRLTWAGLPPTKVPFAIVPAYDTVHFAKPNPAFLAELLALLGWPEGPVVMVGNDPRSDIDCAQQLGIAAFLVQDASQPQALLKNNGNGAFASGDLTQLIPWIEGSPPEMLQPDFSAPSAILATLLSTPAALSSLFRQASRASYAQRPEPGEWSLTEILCHLRDVEIEVNLPRLEKVVRENRPFIPGEDTDPWAEERRYIEQDAAHALYQFVRTRKRLLDLLGSLEQDDWQRPARHAIFGPTTLHELVSIIAGHDRLHVRQVKAWLQSYSQTVPVR